MIYLKNGGFSNDNRLDRLPSVTTEHLEKYPLTIDSMPSVYSSMMVAINWYSNFDVPVIRRIYGVDRYVIGGGDLGHIRGGHAVCGRNWKLSDLWGWYNYYNQGQEGRCVEFASLRLLTQMNRKRYDITSRWHYHTMQEIDEWSGCYLGHNGMPYEGTSGRAGLEVLRAYGAVLPLWAGAPMTLEEAEAYGSVYSEGISTYRWAMNWQDVRTALNVPNYLPGIPISNSWGANYPKEVILLDEAGERVLREDGELGIVTDK